MSDDAVSVIIPAYNAAATIQRALRSVAAQTYPRVAEVIVVDDCSTDGTAEAAAESAIFNLRVVRRDRQGGASAARNDGIRLASAAWIAFLDADDWKEHRLERQFFFVKRHPALRILTCRFELVREDTGEARKPIPVGARLIIPTLEQWLLRQTVKLSIPFGCSGWLAHEQVFQHVGLFNQELAVIQDVEFICRTVAAGYQVAVVAEDLVRYYRTPWSGISRGPAGQYERAVKWAAVVEQFAPWSGNALDRDWFRERLGEVYLSCARKSARAGLAGTAEEFVRRAQETLARDGCRLLAALRTLPTWAYCKACLLRTGRQRGE
ncbi:MAG: glycosyltransferase family 2 protein [Armatimonadetes bacterium]|nr:glycosyltransferase family 2 protein [Armatimonadota bacterium]